MNIEYKDGLEKIVSGINKVTSAVEVTLGGAGNHVAIENPYINGSQITKDGVTVVRSIFLDDPGENIGVGFIKDVASNTLEKVGDGTTTASIIARELIVNSYKAMSQHKSFALKQGINEARIDALAELEKLSREIKTTEDIENIATISANNDSKLGKIIAEAFGIAGTEGLISVEPTSEDKDFIETKKGYLLESGLFNVHYAVNKQKMKTEYDNPLVFLYDKLIQNPNEIRSIIDFAIVNQRSLVLFCEGCKEEVSSIILNNVIQGTISCCLITIPGVGDNRSAVVNDICVITGCSYISSENDIISDVSLHLGSCDKIIINRHTTIIENKEYSDNVLNHISLIESEFSNENNEYRKNNLRKRLSYLKSNSVTLFLSGISDMEVGEKKDRIDDAICATKAALLEGYVPGGGTTLKYIAETMPNKDNIGYSIFMDAISKPYEVILNNAEIEKPKKGIKIGYGINVISGEQEDFYKSGIIDPKKVLRVAIDNAVSVAITVLSIKCLITKNI